MIGILHPRSDLQSSSPLVSYRSDVEPAPGLVFNEARGSSSPLVSSQSHVLSSLPLDLRNHIKQRIDQAAEYAIGRNAEWGFDDCVLWCADILAEPLGYDPAAQFRGRYSTAIGYRRLLTREGFKNLAAAIAAVASDRGWRTIKPDVARTGDIGILVWKQYRPRPEGGIYLTRPRYVQTCALRRGELWIVREQHGVANVGSTLVHHAWSITE